MVDRIDTVRARDSLKARHAPYWQRIRRGCYLGLRKVGSSSPGAWLARFRDEDSGKQVVHSLGAFDDVTGAERFDAAKTMAEEWFAHKGVGGTTAAKTVADACADYVSHLRNTGRNASAKDAEARFVRWVYPRSKLSRTPLLKLTPRAIEEWRNELAQTPAIHQDKKKQTGRPRSRSSINRDMTSFRAALNLALENGHVASDRTWRTKLKPFKDADGRRDVYLDLAQRRQVISCADEELSNLLKGLSVLPLRPGALASLNVGHLDVRLATLTIGKDKAGRDRRIPMPESTLTFLSALAAKRPPDSPLIPRANGTRWTKDAWKAPIKDAALKAGLPSGTVAYAFRHSVITDLIALQRLDTMTVAQLAGTSLIMIERNYGHLLRDHARAALAGLAV